MNFLNVLKSRCRTSRRSSSCSPLALNVSTFNLKETQVMAQPRIQPNMTLSACFIRDEWRGVSFSNCRSSRDGKTRRNFAKERGNNIWSSFFDNLTRYSISFSAERGVSPLMTVLTSTATTFYFANRKVPDIIQRMDDW